MASKKEEEPVPVMSPAEEAQEEIVTLTRMLNTAEEEVAVLKAELRAVSFIAEGIVRFCAPKGDG